MCISSPFEIPHLTSTSNVDAKISIIEDSFPSPANWNKEEFFHCKPIEEELIVNLKGEPFLLIRGGKEIVINKNVEATQQEREVMVLASGIATILIQKNFLLIHGATVLHNRKVNVFVGPKGIGKSTLTAALLAKGYNVIGDDICTIYKDNSGNLCMLRPPRTLKLTEDSISKLEINPNQRDKHCDLKYWLELPDVKASSLPLSKVFALKAVPQDYVSINQIKGTKGFQLILENLYRPAIVDGLGKWKVNFSLASEIASKLGVAEICRPENYFDIDSLVNKIEEEILN